MSQHRNPPAHRQALLKPEQSGFRGDGGTNRFHEVRGGIARVAITAIMEISCSMFPSLRYNNTRTTVLSGMPKLRYVVCRLHQSFHLRAPLGQYLYPSRNRWVFREVAGRLGNLFGYGTRWAPKVLHMPRHLRQESDNAPPKEGAWTMCSELLRNCARPELILGPFRP